MIPWDIIRRDPYRDLFVALAADIYTANGGALTPKDCIESAATFIEALREHDAGTLGVVGAHNPDPPGAIPGPATDTDPNR